MINTINRDVMSIIMSYSGNRGAKNLLDSCSFSTMEKTKAYVDSRDSCAKSVRADEEANQAAEKANKEINKAAGNNIRANEAAEEVNEAAGNNIRANEAAEEVNEAVGNDIMDEFKKLGLMTTRQKITHVLDKRTLGIKNKCFVLAAYVLTMGMLSLGVTLVGMALLTVLLKFLISFLLTSAFGALFFAGLIYEGGEGIIMSLMLGAYGCVYAYKKIEGIEFKMISENEEGPMIEQIKSLTKTQLDTLIIATRGDQNIIDLSGEKKKFVKFMSKKAREEYDAETHPLRAKPDEGCVNKLIKFLKC